MLEYMSYGSPIKDVALAGSMDDFRIWHARFSRQAFLMKIMIIFLKNIYIYIYI